MYAGWTVHEDRLRLAESLTCKLKDLCSIGAQSDNHREVIRVASDDLLCLQQKCHQIIERLDIHRQSLANISHERTLTTDVCASKRFVLVSLNK